MPSVLSKLRLCCAGLLLLVGLPAVAAPIDPTPRTNALPE